MHPDFEKNGYLIARDFFDNNTITLLQTYFDFKYRIINFSEENRINANKSIASAAEVDGDIASSFSFYGDHLIEAIHLKYGQKVSELIRMSLSPTYTYTRIYEKGDSLLPHTDRPACEVSATCPIRTSEGLPSTIFLSNYKIDKNINKPKYSLEEIEKIGDYTEINLYPGDALFYSGCERYHWRKPLDSDYLIQFFLHFVETDGVNKEWVLDKRPYAGFSSTYKNFIIE